MKIKELFSDRSRWCQRSFRRNKDGDSIATVGCKDTEIYSRCLLSAVDDLYSGDKHSSAYRKLQRYIKENYDEEFLINFNDNYPYEEVLKAVEECDV